jgi:molybdopterin-containing oxidoreductase family iron-sulfur binding subunit
MKKYWSSLDEFENKPIQQYDETAEIREKNEILEFLQEETINKPSSRRDFLKFCGFSFATAAVLSSCKNPVNKAIPYLIKPDEVTPGKATYYASTFYDGRDYGSILVKVRDGRPIKIEGNNLSPINKGASSARVQSAILSLYDSDGRLTGPLKEGKSITWDEADKDIIAQLEAIGNSGQKIVLLTSSIISPSTLKLIGEFTAKYKNVSHVTYDSISFSGMIEANKLSFGIEAIPSYHFDKASVIVGFNADFLGTWISPSEFSRQYANVRDVNLLKDKIARHIQFESTLTLTGSNADKRYPIRPSEEGNLLLQLYNELAGKSGKPTFNKEAASAEITEVANELWSKKGGALVVCGTNNTYIQLLVNAINNLLGSYASTIDFANAYKLFQGNDKTVSEFVTDLSKGSVGAVFMFNVNPVYDHPMAATIIEGLKKTKLSVSFATSHNETALLCKYVLPDNHFLESWNDAMPKEGHYTLAQPAINKLFDTRSFQDSLMKWTGQGGDYHEYIRNYWKQTIYPKQTTISLFEQFWDVTLQAGILVFPLATDVNVAFKEDGLQSAAAGIIASYREAQSVKESQPELYLYECLALGNGSSANNPWLQELPDPVSKSVWDNFAAISPKYAAEQGIADGDVIKIKDLEIPVLLQPGQPYGVIAVALGYGRTAAGKVGNKVGVNMFPFLALKDGNMQYFTLGVQITKTAKKYDIARTQMHHSMEGRPIVRETKLAEYIKNPAAGNELHEEFESKHGTLYPKVEFPGHWWGMAIDLNKCTGCNACVIGCQSENNIPVIGKDEMMRKRSMHWIRIDRYYSEDAENPEVVFQPMMCQHCDNAPCENVCPVAATTHSAEGLNQMAYNRCIGTKYCINNCPYKVRRFNWYRYVDNTAFAYGSETEIGKMVLNPDVTVRERGVVEKCSFCVQRIQESKLTAKIEGRELKDGDMMTACMQACASKAIIFGDRNDPESELSKLFENPRNYYILEELHTLPSVGYLTKVRNQE